MTPLIGLLVEVAEGALGTCGGGHGCPALCQHRGSRPRGGDRARVTKLVATATTSASSVIFTELWSSALDDSVRLKAATSYRNFSGENWIYQREVWRIDS